VQQLALTQHAAVSWMRACACCSPLQPPKPRCEAPPTQPLPPCPPAPAVACVAVSLVYKAVQEAEYQPFLLQALQEARNSKGPTDPNRPYAGVLGGWLGQGELAVCSGGSSGGDNRQHMGCTTALQPHVCVKREGLLRASVCVCLNVQVLLTCCPPSLVLRCSRLCQDACQQRWGQRTKEDRTAAAAAAAAVCKQPRHSHVCRSQPGFDRVWCVGGMCAG
jgi:hypothetical protein